MARINYPDPLEGDEVESVLRDIDSQMGRLLNLYRMQLHSPIFTRGFLGISNAIRWRGRLDGRRRELVICLVAAITGSTYEWSQHAPIALREGIRPEQLSALTGWQEASVYSPEERILLAYTEAISREVDVHDDLFAQMQGLFDEAELFELTATIAFYNMVARILVPLRIDVEDGTETVEPPGLPSGAA